MTNKLLSRLTDNPILGFITGLGGFFAIVNSIRGSIGLPLFWSDSLVSTLLLSITIYWTLDSWEKSSNQFKSKIITDTKTKISIKERIKFFGIDIIILPILIGATIWNFYPVISHLINSKWTLCGQFIVNNPRESCLLLYDARNRQISDKFCGLDDSGYKYLEMPNWWTYKPQTVAVDERGDISEEKEIEAFLFNASTCSGLIKL